MGHNRFSRAGREIDLAAMAADGVDLLVVGGGITGAGVARDAAIRGLRVGLVEKGDFSSGTSSRSSKLIHGGVRYLQQGDVSLVLEAAEERRILRRIAPHLTRPRPMMVPAYGMGTHTKLNLGLWAYEKLAGIPELECHEMLDRPGALEREPGLQPAGLTGAAVYPENLTDDARLVLATLRSAKRAGAFVANYAEIVELEAAGTAMIARVRDAENDRISVVTSRVVVNAAGPWSDALRLLEDPRAGRKLHLTKGIHLVVRKEDLPLHHMVVMQARDGRQAFAIPRGEVIYVGTTDTDYGLPEEYPAVTRDDVTYLLEAVRRSFPAATWGIEKVVSVWAGLRPLLHEEGKRPSEISRKDEITVGPHGMITVAGGKLTTYRKMAEKVVDLAEERLARKRNRPCATAEQPLDGGDLPEGASAESFERSLLERYGKSIPCLEGALERIVFLYGTGAEALLEKTAAESSGFFPGTPVLRAEVDRAVESEMALHLVDVLERRLRLLLFDPARGLDLAEEVAARMADLLGWSPSRRGAEVEAYRRIAAACFPA